MWKVEAMGVCGAVRVMVVWLAVVAAGVGAVPGWVERVAEWVVPELRAVDEELAGIGRELERLPVVAGTSSGIRRGFQSGSVVAGEDLWVEVELAAAAVVDSVVLVPLLAKGSRGPVAGFGFPRRFQLEAFDGEGESHVLMDATGDEFPNPGVYPVLVAGPGGVAVVRVRLTATVPWQQGGPPALALAELLVLQGNRNLAAGARVNAASSREIPPAWGRSNLVDLTTQLGLPVAPTGAAMLGWHSEAAAAIDERKQVAVDLGRVVALDEIRLVPAWRRGMPGWFEYGFPSRFRVEVARSADFSDAVTVYDRTARSLLTPGQNVQSYPCEGVPARYLRVTATRLRERTGDYVFALAELQAYAGGENVARGAAVIAEESFEDGQWGRVGLTDGLAGGGRLLEWPGWFGGLERRRRLEARLAMITARRGELLAATEHALVGGSIGVTGAVAVLAAALSWRGRRQRRLERERHRERLARDLHDELGSNLGSIALISSCALQGDSDEGQMRADLAEIERVARESADSMRDMVELLGGRRGGAASDWLGVLRGLAERLLRGVELDCRLPDGVLALEPDLETRREIYLFCKEVLHNVARHAGSARVRFHVRAAPGGLRVEIADDGRGFDPAAVGEGGHGLGNLRQRAAGMRATMHLAAAPGAGTTITLDVPRGRRWRRPENRGGGG